METITSVTAETGGVCKVDVDALHDEIIVKLPADMYIKLFHKMQMKIYDNPSLSLNLWGSNAHGLRKKDKAK